MAQQLATHVELSGLALLQITKHCQEAMPSNATGTLLGMQKNGVLEVTYSFPTPNVDKRGEDSTASSLNSNVEAVDPVKYQEDMLKTLRDVNVDNNNMGFYRSSQGLGGFMDKAFIEDMVDYHRALLSPNFCELRTNRQQQHQCVVDFDLMTFLSCQCSACHATVCFWRKC